MDKGKRSRRQREILPEDAVTQILLRLRVKSLLRFRTVCKSWLYIISEPYFIISHKKIAAKKKPSMLVSKTLYPTPEYYEYIFVPQIFSSSNYNEIFGTCDGIVCVANLHEIYLWNPSIKKYKKLPPPINSNVYMDKVIGFGYDSISDDYKVICFGYGLYSDKIVRVVHLFSTNAGYWKEIDQDNVKFSISCFLYCYSGGVLINGRFYFEERHRERGIVSFDLHNEVIGVIPFHSNMKHKRSNLLDFEGFLAIIIVNYIDSVSDESVISPPVLEEVSLWTLENCNDGRVYWIKKFTFEDDFKISWVDLYMEGKFYRRNSWDGYDISHYDIILHVSYDYKKKVSKYFPVESDEFPKILKYTESLVSFEGFEFTGPEAVAGRPFDFNSLRL